MPEQEEGLQKPRLPNPHLLRIEPAKILEYLLNLDHPKGGGKAKFFFAVGFTADNPEQFSDSMRVHAARNIIAAVIPDDFGIKTVIDCFMPTPSGRDYCIRSVWNDHLDGAPPRLITAHPL